MASFVSLSASVSEKFKNSGWGGAFPHPTTGRGLTHAGTRGCITPLGFSESNSRKSQTMVTKLANT